MYKIFVEQKSWGYQPMLNFLAKQVDEQIVAKRP